MHIKAVHVVHTEITFTIVLLQEHSNTGNNFYVEKDTGWLKYHVEVCGLENGKQSPLTECKNQTPISIWGIYRDNSRIDPDLVPREFSCLSHTPHFSEESVWSLVKTCNTARLRNFSRQPISMFQVHCYCQIFPNISFTGI